METSVKKQKIPHCPLIVNKSFKDETLIKLLSQIFTLRMSDDCFPDFIIPSSHSVACIIVYEDEILFQFKRVDVIQQMKELVTKFSNPIVFFIFESREGLLKLFQLRLDYLGQLPWIILSKDKKSIPPTIKILSQIFTKKRDEERKIQVQMLEESMISKTIAQNIILTIPGLVHNSQDCMILQDSYGSISNLSQLNSDMITSTSPVSQQSAIDIEKFFEE